MDPADISRSDHLVRRVPAFENGDNRQVLSSYSINPPDRNRRIGPVIYYLLDCSSWNGFCRCRGCAWSYLQHHRLYVPSAFELAMGDILRQLLLVAFGAKLQTGFESVFPFLTDRSCFTFAHPGITIASRSINRIRVSRISFFICSFPNGMLRLISFK